jgi:non-ribosomal peptide synthetase-like protein
MLISESHEHAIRWRPGERLDHLFEQRCDQLRASGQSDHLAVSTGGADLTFDELDQRANQVARYLLRQGIKSGDRVGLLFDRSIHTYVALLGVLKINAAYVPLDASFPQQRIDFIVSDAELRTILTLSAFASHLRNGAVAPIFLDAAEHAVASEETGRLSESEKGEPADELCYIVYTSGSTGNPKGVAIEHASICNFVRVAGEVYGFRQDDRVYQGMTLAFDFSVEELWVPLIAGATLVPGKADASLVGRDLAAFVLENRITALCCVPTLLATIEEDLPALRFLLVSGEACPQDLVVRWHREGRKILNAYGPTEATVTATWTELHPGEPVTIGRPLPTYSIVILEEHGDEPVPDGELGEICIAGIGLARGYVNRDDLTEKSFIPDSLRIPNNPSQRIYRTGDLGRITERGEIEFHGRIDTQVKIRGYRIELTEIESVLLELPQIAQAVVSTHEPEPGLKELVAYYTLREDACEPSQAEISEALRSRLPGYMIPAFVERLSVIPMLPSNKADRKSLPPPQGPRLLAGGGDHVDPEGELQETLASALGDVLKIGRVSAADNFFEELGAHSLLMARFCAEIRRRLPGTEVSMRDVYLNPSVAELADHLEAQPGREAVRSDRVSYRVPTNLEYYGCGALQLLAYVVFGFAASSVGVAGFSWIRSSADLVDLGLRAAGFAVLVFTCASATCVAMKWLLVGRWKRETIPIWGLRYLRFWLAKQFIQISPMVLLSGSPLYNAYLRLLGAKIGRNVVVQAKLVPVCTDLLTIGDNTILRRDSIVLGYKAEGNYIHTGPISIGSDAFVGEGSVLDIDTVMGDGSQLGHSSSLQAGQTVPSGQRYHGSPAQETAANYCPVEPRTCTNLRKAVYSLAQLAVLLVAIAGPILLAMSLFQPLLHQPGSASSPFSPTLLLSKVALALVLFSGLGALYAAAVFALPRLLNRFLTAGRVYPLFGPHYFIFNVVQWTSNSRYLNAMFGDSSFVVYYLKLLGYDLSKVHQTGSNFGLTQQHDSPFLCRFGTGTMISDGFAMINVQMSPTSFALCKAEVGERSFVGNNVHYPPDAKTGANCLIATKAMVPIDGPVRQDVGLLGSPCFEIPRSVYRDRSFGKFDEEPVRRQRLRQKNVHNLLTIGALSLAQIAYLLLFTSVSYAASVFQADLGTGAWVLAGYAGFVLSLGYFIAVERLGLAGAKMTPQTVSIYDREYWRVERYWKCSESPAAYLFKGTPLKNVISRLLGIRVGRKVFDDGAYASEKRMVEIGDYCSLNEASVLQGHSLEEGVFKSDCIKLGRGCSVGVGAFVHYGASMDDNSTLDADSFLMKGESVEANSTWRGNPATVVWRASPSLGSGERDAAEDAASCDAVAPFEAPR